MSNYWNDDTPSERYDPQAEQRAAELVQAARDHWRDEALKEYPAVQPLAEYLNADSREATFALAKDLSEKLSGSQPQESGPAVPGGSPALPSSQVGEEDEITVLREKVRQMPTNKNWSEYLRAKYHAAGLPYVDEV